MVIVPAALLAAESPSYGRRRATAIKQRDTLIENFLDRLGTIDETTSKLLAPSNLDSAVREFGAEFVSRISKLRSASLNILLADKDSKGADKYWVQISDAICQTRIVEPREK